MDDGQPFELTGSATVAADGTATVTLQLQAAGRYEVDLISVYVDERSDPSSIATIYRNGADPGNFIEDTKSGDRNADTQISLRLQTGQSLVCQWTGAAVGATARLRIEGDYAP